MRVATIVGARPNFIKTWGLCHAIAALDSSRLYVDHRIIHTGQHYDASLSERNFDILGLPRPALNLGIGSGSAGQQVGLTLAALHDVLGEWRPNWVVVVGDVNACLAGALAAKKLHLKVAHIEAGLRSDDWSMPEEINRILTDRVSDRLYTTTDRAGGNLLREGTPAERISLVGNIMIDALDHVLPRIPEPRPAERALALVTLHRPANVDDEDRLKRISMQLQQMRHAYDILFPMHPRTRARFDALCLSPEGVNMVEPYNYIEMIAALRASSVVITDSGGLQEECCVLGVPAVVLRRNTERPETLAENGGTCILCPEPESIADVASRITASRPAAHRPPLWDGRTGTRILQDLIDRLDDPPRGIGCLP